MTKNGRNKVNEKGEMELVRYVASRPNIAWNYKKLCANENVTLEMILAHPEIPWDLGALCLNRNLTYEFLMAQSLAGPVGHLAILDFIMNGQYQLGQIESRYANAPFYLHEYIQVNPHINPWLTPQLQWTKNKLSRNPHLTVSLMLEHENSPGEWNWALISIHVGITLTDILAHPSWKWAWSHVSQNPNITFRMIQAHPELPWSWPHVSGNPNVTLTEVLQHPEIRWNWDLLAANPTVSLEYLLQHHPRSVSQYIVRRNPNQTLAQVLAHPELPWRWSLLLETLGDYPYYSHLQVALDEHQNSLSYWSYLPMDMLTHYFVEYFQKVRTT